MWKIVKLNEIVNIDIGKTPSRNNPKYWDKNKKNSNVWVSIRDMSALSDIYISDSREYISNEGARLFKEVPQNTLIMSFKLSIGKLAITKINLRTNEAIAAFKIKDRTLVSKEYLYYFLSSMNWDKIAGQDIKVKGKTLNKAKLKEILITLPLLSEQQRIVSKLKVVFAEIDKSIVATKKNINNSKKLFLNNLDNLVNEPKLGKKMLLGEVCTLSQGLAINKSTKHLLVTKSTKPLLRIKDLISNTFQKYIDSKYKNKKTIVNKEDLIFTRTGSLGLVFRGREGVLHNNSFKVEPKNILNKDYMYWWLQNSIFLKKIHFLAGKAAQPDISHKLFNCQYIIIPTLNKQKEILQKIEKCMSDTKTLKELYKDKLNNLIQFKQLVLKQELNGELNKAS